MFQNFNYAYVVGNLLVGFPIWLLCFIHRKDLRREILFSSVIFGILSLATEPWFMRDYWHPESLNLWRIRLGDFTYGFFFGGIANVIYEEILGKHFASRKNRAHHWSWFLVPFAALGLFMFGIPLGLGMNSIYASLVAMIVLAGCMVYFRRDLVMDALLSGALFGIVTLAGYLVFVAVFPGIIEAWWKLENVSGVLVLGIPIEELLWAFGLGMFAGPLYEFFAGLRFKKTEDSTDLR